MHFFELSDKSEVATAWFLSMANGDDLMAMVFRDSAEDPWKAVVRHRKRVDNLDPFESKDDKTGYAVTGQATSESRDHLLNAMASFFSDVQTVTGGGRLHRVDVNGDAEAFTTAWSRMPFAHAKVYA